MKKIFYITILIFTFYFYIPQKSYAYLDPNTGSMILQMIVAGVVGLGCTIGIWKDKLFNLFKKEKNDSNNQH